MKPLQVLDPAKLTENEKARLEMDGFMTNPGHISWDGFVSRMTQRQTALIAKRIDEDFARHAVRHARQV